MINQEIPTTAFTIEYHKLVNVLYTGCRIGAAFNNKIQHKEEIPNMHEFRAIWDTGASASVISKNVVDKLGLEPTGIAQVFHANGISIVNTYSASIFLPNGIVFTTLKVTEAILPTGTDVLIGMDIISRGDFAITSSNNKTKFSFQIPSTHNTDYEKEIQKINKRLQSSNTITQIVGRNLPCSCGSGKKYKKCCGKLQNQ